ncbi:MAG: hypothetical protein ABI599_15185 [Flavobacteriales bacterium]
MIRSASLFYAVIVALLLSALLGGVLLTAHLRSMRTERWLAFTTARDRAHDALMQCASARFIDDAQYEGPGSDSVMMVASAWGLYWHCACRAQQSDQGYGWSSLMACQWPADAPGLWLADHGEPIALAGATVIEGPCYLPHAGLRRAYIEGNPFSGSLEIDGQRTSERQFPELPEHVRDALNTMAELRGPRQHDRTVDWNAIADDTLRVAFDEGILFVDANGTHTLSGRVLEGRIVVHSRDSLRLAADLGMGHAIVIAPQIHIAEGFKGSLQCFATEAITVGKEVELLYPSVLVCECPDHSPRGGQTALIALGEGARCEGAILGVASKNDANAFVLVQLGVGSYVAGELWNNGPVEVRGTFEGVLMADRLTLRTASSVYRDHLLDAVVRPLHDPHFAGIGLWDTGAVHTVLAWTATTERP